MIDLDNTELVLFDFDDTLYIHTSHGCTPEDDLTYDVRVLKLGSDAWLGITSRHMKEFMDLCKKLNKRMGLISATVSYAHAQGKHDWVLREYGVDLENYCVGSPEAKLRIMCALSKVEGIPRSKILLVDDFWNNLETAENNGFAACSPMEVVNFIEKMH